MRGALALVISSLAGPTLAGDFSLGWPLDCTLGADCFIEDYVDRNPAQGEVADFACGLNSRDGHNGTDIALLSFDAVATGVSVLAAAPGTVMRIRDSMTDDRLMPGVTSTNACGNAVLISHADGYQTLYCHMRQGSVLVRPGQRVVAGDQLGLVGLSGRTTHPHLHLTVMLNGAIIDPFAPDPTAACGATARSLWVSDPGYDRTLLRLAGFARQVPGYTALRSGAARVDTITPADAMVVFAEAGYAEPGDKITITATGPEGVVFTHTRILEDPKVSQLPAYGRHAPEGGWPTGAYLGQITLTRADRVIANRFAHVVVRP